MCSYFTCRASITLSHICRSVLLVFPNRQKSQDGSLIHHRVDLANWQLDYYSLSQLRFCLTSISNSSHLPSRFCSELLAATANFLPDMHSHLHHLCFWQQVPSNGGHHLCSMDSCFNLHHTYRSFR